MSRGYSKRLTFSHLVEGVRLALETLVDHRMRSSLVILGVSISVATAMGMVAILSGFGQKITDEVKGGDVPIFSVTRFSHLDEGNDEQPRPKLHPLDAEDIARLPEVSNLEIRYGQGHGRSLQHGDKQASLIYVMGSSLAFQDFQKVDLEFGRYFTEGELRSALPVCVLAERTALDLFPGEGAVDKTIRVNGEDYRVVGVFAHYDSLFGGLFENYAVIPYTTYEHRMKDKWESAQFNVFPVSAAALDAAVDSTRGLLRARHHLRPGEDDDFSITTSDAALEFTKKFTGPIALVLVLISSIGLMVGGIGVLIIMLVSVTERTREIGVRKSIGASRREILWQFLIEAGVLTLIGGILGIGLGLLLARGASQAMHFPFILPLDWIAIAVVVSGGIGLVFGLYPANRAARLDPIESLRYE
jgi:putative ABC transport system permease protein